MGQQYVGVYCFFPEERECITIAVDSHVMMNAITERWLHTRWAYLPPRVIFLAFLALAVLTTQQARAAVECEALRWEPERLDFNAAKDQRRVRQVESHHFDARVESLVRGKTSDFAGADIDFLVRYSPNHHRGLAALVRLSLRDKTLKPIGVNIAVECYLLRAIEFRPSDAEVHKIYGTYLVD